MFIDMCCPYLKIFIYMNRKIPYSVNIWTHFCFFLPSLSELSFYHPELVFFHLYLTLQSVLPFCERLINLFFEKHVSRSPSSVSVSLEKFQNTLTTVLVQRCCFVAAHNRTLSLCLSSQTYVCVLCALHGANTL